MKKLFELIPAVTLTLALGAFNVGCASKDKCETSEACCDGGQDCCKNGGECKDDCKGEGDCKDGAKTQPAPAAAPSAQAPVNTICPIGEHDANPNLTAPYQGKSIAFCCDDCKQQFLAMDASGQAALFAKASAK